MSTIKLTIDSAKRMYRGKHYHVPFKQSDLAKILDSLANIKQVSLYPNQYWLMTGSPSIGKSQCNGLFGSLFGL